MWWEWNDCTVLLFCTALYLHWKLINKNISKKSLQSNLANKQTNQQQIMFYLEACSVSSIMTCFKQFYINLKVKPQSKLLMMSPTFLTTMSKQFRVKLIRVMSYLLQSHKTPAGRHGNSQVAADRLSGCCNKMFLSYFLWGPKHLMEPCPTQHHLGNTVMTSWSQRCGKTQRAGRPTNSLIGYASISCP